MTRAESCDENAEWYPYFLIKPDPRCSECVTIMDWRSAHREFIITNGTEIKLSDYGWGGRHLYKRDVGSLTTRSAWSGNARNGRAKNISTRWRGPVVPVADSVAPFPPGRPPSGDQSTYRKARRSGVTNSSRATRRGDPPIYP